MPLNINLQQIMLHMLNFVILIGGLYMLLFKPVKDFMENRQAAYKKADEDAKTALDEAEAKVAEYNSKIGNADKEIAAKRAESIKATDKEIAEKIANAEAEAKEILADARVNAEAEKKSILASAQTEIRDFALEAAKKIATSGDTLADFLDANEEV